MAVHEGRGNQGDDLRPLSIFEFNDLFHFGFP
jgi:hypothetical protein